MSRLEAGSRAQTPHERLPSAIAPNPSEPFGVPGDTLSCGRLVLASLGPSASEKHRL